ncbi:exopolysaccharide biosynthesis polyprenyl glycosylphosphotransferase [Streptococcus sp. 45]|uniref:sugar transferase n=1 Tax=Streptococcus sp. 45 TaxID=1855326 RepID=UPI0008AB60B2|nr:sugar transferase [Streptococcus sp. 45]SEI62917.1 exopolysaccharide biosynthesis polyprenyl glycosylphosphotransferase [Streptococcus sp. 45]
MYSEDSKKKVYYLLSDIVALLVAYKILASFYPYHFFGSNFFGIIFAALLALISVLNDEYSNVLNRGYFQELKASIVYGTRTVVLLSLVLILGKFRFIHDISSMSYYFLVYLFLVVTALVFFGRVFFKRCLKPKKSDSKKIILVTDFSDEDKLEEVLKSSNYQVLAYVSHNKRSDLEYPVIWELDEIRDFVANHQVDEIYVNKDYRSDFREVARYIRLLGIPTTVKIGNYSDYYVADSVIKKLDDITFVTTATNIVKCRQLVLKRMIDILGAIVGIIITGIVAVIIAPIVKKQSPGPLIFKQKRVGKNGKIFNIYKFRSMYTDAEERKKELLAQNDLDTNLMFKMEDDPRIFPFGHKLRDWSLDELPQFINVLKGEMSVVGTRPPTLDEYRHYELHHFKRMTTKPGITGLWQVSGRSDITDFEEVVALDMKYIQNWSISDDIKIIAKTVKVVLKREGSR